MKISVGTIALFFSLFVQECVASSSKGKKSKTEAPAPAPGPPACPENEKCATVCGVDEKCPVCSEGGSCRRLLDSFGEGFDFEGLLEERGADPHGAFDVTQSLLSQEECNKLIDFSKAKASNMKEVRVFGEGQSQLAFNRVPLDESDLLQLISEDSIQQISKAMNHLPLTKFYLQEVLYDESQSGGISLHMDRVSMEGHGASMIVLLGEEDAGADFIYVTPQGLVAQELSIGDALVHYSDVLHGVDNMKGHIFSLHVESVEGRDHVLSSLEN